MSLKCLSNHGNLFKVQHGVFYAAWLVHILFCITKPRWRHALTLTLPKHLHTQTNSTDAPHHTHDTCVTCLSYMSHVTVTVWHCDRACMPMCSLVYGWHGSLEAWGEGLFAFVRFRWVWLCGCIYAASLWQRWSRPIPQVSWGLIVSL